MRHYEMQSFGPGIKRVFTGFAVGSSGAVPAKTAWLGSHDAITVTRTDTGQYTIAWDERYKASLIGVSVTPCVGASGSNPTITQDVRLGLASTSGRFVKFTTLTSGSAADLASGSMIFIELTFKTPSGR